MYYFFLQFERHDNFKKKYSRNALIFEKNALIFTTKNALIFETCVFTVKLLDDDKLA